MSPEQRQTDNLNEIDSLREKLIRTNRELETALRQLSMTKGESLGKDLEIQHLRELINSAAVNGTA